jgi:hypothetical protein
MSKKTSDCKSCEENRNNSLPQRDVASYASSGNISGALTASFGLAVDPNTAGKLGTRLGGKPAGQLMSFIETPGSNKQKRSMSDTQKKKHLINSVGLGNFSLNSTFESGLVSSISGARGESSGFLGNNKTGASLMAASALGIDVPGGDMLGIGPGDSSMFKVCKLAACGLKLLCAGLKGTKRGPGGYNSDTEESLGLLLTLGINLDLFDRLKSIFDKLKNLKFNFSSFDLGDLNIANVLFNLCDWVENMEYGSNTIDTFRKSFAGGLTNKALTESVGKKLIGAGTYDTHARNDFGFDQQFKSIAGDIGALKCDACNLGKTDIIIAQGNKDLVNLEFDARTGLQRETGWDKNTTTKTPISEGEINKISDTEKSPFNQPVTQKEIDEYVPSASEQSVLKDLSSREKKSFIKENVRAKKQIEQMKSKRKSSTKPKLGVADNLTKPVLAGADTLQVNDPTQFWEGSWSVLDEGTAAEECIERDGYGSLKLKNPLQKNHAAGSTLSPPSLDCQLSSDIKSDYSKKSISTQVDDIKNKVDTPSADTITKPNIKSVEDHLGIKKEEQLAQIESSMSEMKTKLPTEQMSTKFGKKPTTSSDLQSQIKNDAKASHDFTESTSKQIGTPGVSYETENKSIVYDTYTDEDGSIKEDTYEQNENKEFEKTKSKTKFKKPVGGPPAAEDADEVTSFHTGETITKEELKGTVLEGADLNAVSLLHPNDLENLKDTEEVNKVLADADKVHTEKFETEIEKTENKVLEQQSGGIIFGVQLPTTLNGNQIVMNSERILISAKTQEMGLFSKRKFFITTDDEITMNCKQRFVVKSDRHASFEAPTVHLGLYTTRNHPTLKGDCTKWWLDDLCDWLAGHSHNDPYVTTGTPVQQGSLAALKARTPTLLSERIFISG